MKGIDLNKPIVFKHSSLRYFSKNEHHISRICEDDVLVLVFEGVLRFTEDGIRYEIFPGEYHIQKFGSVQKGEVASDSPKYLYAHFRGEWADNDTTLPYTGTFDYSAAKLLMEELDRLSHSNSTLTERTAKLYELMLMIRKKEKSSSIAERIAEFIDKEKLSDISLEIICEKFNFSKNHIINTFKKEYGITPNKYINSLKLAHAKYLLEVTSNRIEGIALESGFNDYSNFYKLFFRETGLSPVEWRSQKQKKPSLL